MATKTSTDVPTLAKASPPKMQRGRPKVVIPDKVLDAWAAALADGDAIEEPNRKFDSRPKASSEAVRLRVALVDSGKAEEKAIATRVYSTNPEDNGKKAVDQEGPFAFCLQLRQVAS